MSSLSLFLNDIHVLGIGTQRPEGLAAVLIEPVEKLQTLQAHIVDEAAQQVEGKVDAVAQHQKHRKPERTNAHE